MACATKNADLIENQLGGASAIDALDRPTPRPSYPESLQTMLKQLVQDRGNATHFTKVRRVITDALFCHFQTKEVADLHSLIENSPDAVDEMLDILHPENLSSCRKWEKVKSYGRKITLSEYFQWDTHKLVKIKDFDVRFDGAMVKLLREYENHFEVQLRIDILTDCKGKISPLPFKNRATPNHYEFLGAKIEIRKKYLFVPHYSSPPDFTEYSFFLEECYCVYCTLKKLQNGLLEYNEHDEMMLGQFLLAESKSLKKLLKEDGYIGVVEDLEPAIQQNKNIEYLLDFDKKYGSQIYGEKRRWVQKNYFSSSITTLEDLPERKKEIVVSNEMTTTQDSTRTLSRTHKAPNSAPAPNFAPPAPSYVPPAPSYTPPAPPRPPLAPFGPPPPLTQKFAERSNYEAELIHKRFEKDTIDAYILTMSRTAKGVYSCVTAASCVCIKSSAEDGPLRSGYLKTNRSDWLLCWKISKCDYKTTEDDPETEECYWAINLEDKPPRAGGWIKESHVHNCHFEAPGVIIPQSVSLAFLFKLRVAHLARRLVAAPPRRSCFGE